MNKFLSLFHRNHVPETGLFRRNYFWYKIGDDPFVDWALIFSLSVVIAIVLVAFGAYVYVDGAAQLSSMSPISATGSPASHFDTKELARIISAFDGRANERVLLIRGYSGPSDPSLP
jgi:hypothetical protein